MYNRFLLFLWLLGVSLVSCDTGVKTEEPPIPSQTITVKVDLAKEFQVMDGFGASDAWRCQFVGKNWPMEKKEAIADLLFSQEADQQGNPKGIGLSIWRFNLGAGSAEQGSGSKIPDEWRRGECFMNPDGTYNWDKQEGQRWFLRAAKARGVEKFLLFTNSPPVYMTSNGKAFASNKQANMNIKGGFMPNFANYLVNCVSNIQQREGINFDYLSPVNETQWDWAANNQGENSQEGSPATNTEVIELTKLLSTRLQQVSPQTKVMLADAATLEFLYKGMNNGERDDQINTFFAKEKLANLPNVANCISGHSYFTVWPLSDQIMHREKLANRLQQVSPTTKYWQSEYCILENPGESEIPNGSGHGRDLGIKTALFVARLIHNDIAVAGASSWQWWTALTRVDYKDGLIYLDNGTPTGNPDAAYCKTDGYYRTSKLLWALGNYSFFIRPGMVRIQIENGNAQNASENVMLSAYLDKQNKKLVIVSVNVTNQQKEYKFSFGNGVLKDNSLVPYVTSDKYDLNKMDKVKIDAIKLPARSIVTFVGDLSI